MNINVGIHVYFSIPPTSSNLPTASIHYIKVYTDLNTVQNRRFKGMVPRFSKALFLHA